MRGRILGISTETQGVHGHSMPTGARPKREGKDRNMRRSAIMAQRSENLAQLRRGHQRRPQSQALATLYPPNRRRRNLGRRRESTISWA
jgi:hypothetical protein